MDPRNSTKFYDEANALLRLFLSPPFSSLNTHLLEEQVSPHLAFRLPREFHSVSLTSRYNVEPPAAKRWEYKAAHKLDPTLEPDARPHVAPPLRRAR